VQPIRDQVPQEGDLMPYFQAPDPPKLFEVVLELRVPDRRGEPGEASELSPVRLV
jgi:hypothetical protein